MNTAATLAQGLEQEQKSYQELEEALSDFVRRFGADNLEVGPSARSRLSAVGGYLRSELRNAFRSGVRTCMAVFCSHFPMESKVLDGVAKGFFLGSDDEEEVDPAERDAADAAKTQTLYDFVDGAATRLASRFEDEVCPPYSPIESTYEADTEMVDAQSEDAPAGPTPPSGEAVVEGVARAEASSSAGREAQVDEAHPAP